LGIYFCEGVSLVSNTLLQNAIVELNVIDLFVRIMETTQYIDVKVRKSKVMIYRFFCFVQVECCLTLSKLVLNNNENQQRLADEFNVENIVFQFIQITEPGLKLRALFGLSLFAYNNLENQSILKQTNAVLHNSFQPFMEATNSIHSAMACFQVYSIFYLSMK
jgi:hypothetical protein